MSALSIKNLSEEKLKFSMSVFSIGLAVTLILVLVGVYIGSIKQSRALPENSGTDFWIVQEGSRDMFHTVSLLPADLDETLTDLPSIKKAGGVINSPTDVKIGDSSVTVGVVGFDEKTNYLRPADIIEGTNQISDSGTVIDKVLSIKYDVMLGDEIEISGHKFRVEGISEKTNAIVFQYLFITSHSARNLNETRKDIVNYYAFEPAGDIEQAKADILKVLPQATVRTTDEIADDNSQVVEDSFLTILVLLVFVGATVSSLVVALTIYNATNSKLHEFGVLKAIGMSRAKLTRLVIVQSIITGLTGLFVGIALYYVVTGFSPVLFPSVEFDISNRIIVIVAIGALTSSIFASLVPVLKLNSVDPVEVFNT